MNISDAAAAGEDVSDGILSVNMFLDLCNRSLSLLLLD